MNILNGIPALSVKLTIPWRGAWTADVELDAPNEIAAQLLATSGLPAVLLIDTIPFQCIIDPTGSGTLSSKAVVRVIGGRGGWGKKVGAKHFVGPGGSLLSSVVFLATGLEVGEAVVDPTPSALGTNYGRVGGPASDIFDMPDSPRDWFVDPISSTTIVSAWPPSVTTATIIDFSPVEMRVTLNTEDLPVFPGAVLVDPRFNGATYTVRDVELTFDKMGSRAECWCGKASSPLADAFAQAVQKFAGTRYLRTYRYRLAGSIANKLVLQAVTKDAPDMNPLDQWSGLSGALDMLSPGTELVIGFAGGDPRYPYVAAYGPDAVPINIGLTATAAITLTAPAIGFAGASTFGVPGTALPLAFGPWAAAVQGALSTFAASVAAAASVPAVQAAGAALATAVGALPPAQTVFMKGN